MAQPLDHASPRQDRCRRQRRRKKDLTVDLMRLFQQTVVKPWLVMNWH